MNIRAIVTAILTVLATAAPEASARLLDSELGRWTRRDPLGYVDGMGVYEYVGSTPITGADMYGLSTAACGFNCDSSAEGVPDVPLQQDIVDWLDCYLGSEDRSECLACCRSSSVYLNLACVTACYARFPHGPPQLPAPRSRLDCLNPSIRQPNLDSCNVYDECGCLHGVNVKCMCQCMGTATAWENFVRACLQCMRKTGISWSAAHALCWAAAPGESPAGQLAICGAKCAAHQLATCGAECRPPHRGPVPGPSPAEPRDPWEWLSWE